MKLFARAVPVLLPLLVAASALAEPVTVMSPRDRLYDVASHGDALFVVGHPGHLLRSRDGGRTFESLSAGQADQALFAIAFNSKGQGVVVGRSGIVLFSSDGGQNWTKSVVTFGDEPAPGLFGVDILEDGTIVAVGEFGLIARSEDQAKTFARVTYNVDAPQPAPGSETNADADADADGTTASAPTDPAAAAAADANGDAPVCPDLESSEDENMDSIDEARLADVLFLDEKRGYAVGEFGLVIETTDAGRSFHRRNGCSMNMLYNLAAVGPEHLLAVGFGGTAVESTDAGQHWAPLTTGTTEDLYSVSVTATKTLVVGAAGTVLVREGDGGFVGIETGVHSWLVSSWLGNDGAGLIVGGRAHILRTQDSGRTLQRISGD